MSEQTPYIPRCRFSLFTCGSETDINLMLDKYYVLDYGTRLVLFSTDSTYESVVEIDVVEIDIASATSDNGWNYSFYGIPTDKELRLRFDNASYNGQPITLPDVFVIKASMQYGSGSGTGGAGTDTGSGTGGGTDSGSGTGGAGTDDVNVTTPSGIGCNQCIAEQVLKQYRQV